MTENALSSAQAGDQQAFAALTDPYRRELQLHCYRILGQVQDAEDAVQETLLAAWRGLDTFEERSTLRSWLYRIATNRCLNMLRDSARRPTPALGSSGLSFIPPEPTRYAEALWLEPYPDVLLEGIADAGPGPHARYETREAVSLAFLTALHRLPPAPARRARASRHNRVLGCGGRRHARQNPDLGQQRTEPLPQHGRRATASKTGTARRYPTPSRSKN